MTTRDPKPWIVHHRDGWCALPAGAKPDPEALNDPTLCGHVVTMRGGHKRGTPDCPECLDRLLPAALPGRVAHVTARDGSGPLTASEVCEYDDPGSAQTVRHTGAAPHHGGNT